VVLQRNYLEVYPYDKWASSAVPDFQQDEQFMPSVLEVRDGKTSRPNLLTEADLVGLMDKNGIGKLALNWFRRLANDRYRRYYR
jgi:DNA topoisomerase-3